MREPLSCGVPCLELGDLGRLRAFVARLDVELDAVALVEVLVTLAQDGAVMYKDILAAIVGRDEAVALLSPLNHFTTPVTRSAMGIFSLPKLNVA